MTNRLEKLLDLHMSAMIFLLLNLLIVSAHILGPRFLNHPDIEIISQTMLVDEPVIEMSGREAYTLAELTRLYYQPISLSRQNYCAKQIWPNRLIPESCAPIINETLQEIVKSSTLLRDKILHALNNIDQYDRGEIAEVLLSTDHIYLEREALNVFFNLLATDTILKDDIADPIKRSFVESAKGMVSSAFAYIERLESLNQRVKDFPGNSEPTTRFAIKVNVENGGYADGIVFSQAIMSVVGVEIPMIALPQKRVIHQSSVAYAADEVISARQVKTIFLVPDRIRSSAQAIGIIDRFLIERSPMDFEISLVTTNNRPKTSGTWTTERVSFDSIFEE